jgi:TolA-binding protein
VGNLQVNFRRSITALASAAAIALLPVSVAVAQRQPPTPEQRIDRLERQLDEVQRRVFPKGRPAATAGFPDDPAATQASVINLDQRLNALERQMTDMLRQSEENGNRLRTLEQGIAQLRNEQEQRMQALEQRLAASPPPATAEAVPPAPPPPRTRPSTTATKTVDASPALISAPISDPAEDAYTEGFRMWEAGNYDDAIRSLRAFVAAYPRHRRTSYANNLIGRALLDKGQPQAAATALLANYRGNPGGERAPDSLYYLGQALMQLNQPGQACKAFAELDAVYGAKIRPDLKKLEADAKAKANCS